LHTWYKYKKNWFSLGYERQSIKNDARLSLLNILRYVEENSTALLVTLAQALDYVSHAEVFVAAELNMVAICKL